jgi:hypothetical protein
MQALGILRATIVAGMDARKFRAVNAENLARALWAAMHGITSLLIQMPNFAWGDQQAVIDALIETTIEGLRPRPKAGAARNRRTVARRDAAVGARRADETPSHPGDAPKPLP